MGFVMLEQTVKLAVTHAAGWFSHHHHDADEVCEVTGAGWESPESYMTSTALQRTATCMTNEKQGC